MILKKIIAPAALALSFITSNAYAQFDFKSDFQRQLHIQTLEEQAYFFERKYNLNFNVILLDINQAADLNFVGSIATLKKHYNYFLASSYLKESSFNGNKSPACVIFINYKNNASLIAHRLAYKDKLDSKKSAEFINYYLMAHEIAHCVSQDRLPFSNNVDEKYADTIAGFFILNSEYAALFNYWQEQLAKFEGEHKTYAYVNKIYSSNRDIKTLDDLISIIKRTPN